MFRYFAIPALAIALASCGTVSKLDPAVTGGKTYSKVLVKDFAYRGSASELTGPASATTFPNFIKASLQDQGAFKSVARTGRPDADTLVISGDVTRYVTGSPALRLTIGLGAGSSYFDADVRFSDGKSGQQLGVMKVDKNSWVLGGGIAATQSPEAFMQSSSKAVAKEAVKFSNSKPGS